MKIFTLTVLYASILSNFSLYSMNRGSPIDTDVWLKTIVSSANTSQFEAQMKKFKEGLQALPLDVQKMVKDRLFHSYQSIFLKIFPASPIVLDDDTYVPSLAISDDGKKALTADSVAKLWFLGERIVGIPSSVELNGNKATMTPDGKTALTSISEKGTSTLWFLDNAIPGRIPNSVDLPGDKHINVIAISSDGNRAFTGLADGTVKLWLLSNASPKDKTPPHIILGDNPSSITSISITSKGNRALISTFDGSLKLYFLPDDMPNSTPGSLLLAKGRFQGTTAKENLVSALALTPDGNKALTGTLGGKVKLWFLNNANPDGEIPPSASLVGHEEGEKIRSLAITPDGKVAITGSNDGTARIWFLANARPENDISESISLFDGHSNDKHYISQVAITPDGKIALTGSSEGTVKLWFLDNVRPGGKEPFSIPLIGHEGREIESLAITPDHKRALIGSYMKKILLWDLTIPDTVSLWEMILIIIKDMFEDKLDAQAKDYLHSEFKLLGKR